MEEATRAHRVALERERDQDIKNIDEWEDATRKIATDHLDAQQAIYDQELANARRFITNQADLLLAEREINQKRTRLINQTVEELERIQREAQKRRDQIELQADARVLALRDAQRKAELDALRRSLNDGLIIESAFLKRELELTEQAFNDRQIHRDLELNQLTTSAERKADLDNDKTESEIKHTEDVKRLTDERIKARRREVVEGTPAPGGPVAIDPNRVFDDSFLGPVPKAEDPIDSLSEAFARLGEQMHETFGIGAEAGKQFGEVLDNAFSEIGFAVGDLVHQWVLFGTTGPAAMRRVTAAVLASLAAQAAVKAVFQLAEGFAALFLNPAQAAAHFKAAALFGAVAGAAAIAGRSVAGDLFTRGHGGGR